MTGAAPKLRFPEFREPWRPTSVSTLLERKSDPVEVDLAQTYRQIGVRSHGKGIFHKESVTGAELGDKRVFHVVPNALVVNIVFAWEQAVALTSNAESGFIASHRFPMFSEKNGKSYLSFLRHMFLTKRGKLLLEMASPGGAGRNKTLGQQEFLKLKPVMPSRAEQVKIADAICAVDAKLVVLGAKRAALGRFKAGLMQKLFSQQLRFTQDDGQAFQDWEETRLGEVFERIRRKNEENNTNVLTISAQQGLVSQQDYFNKSVSANEVTGYYLLHRGDFAYNKSYSKGYPMGAIKRLNKYEKGVVSTLYICFNTAEEVTARYFEQFFESGFLNREIEKIAQEGARNHGLLNVGVKDFFDQIYFLLPCPDEQQKIADALSAMDAKIQAVADQVTKLETFKKGLLQQMFV